MKNKKAMLLLMWIFSILPFVITIFVFNKLPAEIPMHWDYSGEIDAWYPKFPWAFLLPTINIILTILIGVIPRLDPKKENYVKFKPQYNMLKFLFVIFFAILQMVTILISLGIGFIRIDTFVKAFTGILFIFIGNMLPKFKHNYFVGIKTPWTIASERVWSKTHRHGGPVWFIIGFLMVFLSFIPGLVSAVIYFILILIAAIEPMFYSWWSFKKDGS